MFKGFFIDFGETKKIYDLILLFKNNYLINMLTISPPVYNEE